MKVQLLSNAYCYNTQSKTATKPSFKAGMPVETIKHYNLGMMPNGIIGKVKVLKANGEEAFLNVCKQVTIMREIYRLQDDMDRVIGKIELKPRKFENYSKFEYKDDPSHIFVEELRNYSRPGTPYHMKDLEEYKQVGVRLMQIAQRRSDECGLNGNIEFVSKNESMPFYEKLGFKRVPFISIYVNPNKMYLPPEAKEPFSRAYGGL